MATIRPRKRAGGTISYAAQIRIKKDGVQVYTESQTFVRKKAAEAGWSAQRHDSTRLIAIIEPWFDNRAKLHATILSEPRTGQ